MASLPWTGSRQRCCFPSDELMFTIMSILYSCYDLAEVHCLGLLPWRILRKTLSNPFPASPTEKQKQNRTAASQAPIRTVSVPKFFMFSGCVLVSTAITEIIMDNLVPNHYSRDFKKWFFDNQFILKCSLI